MVIVEPEQTIFNLVQAFLILVNMICRKRMIKLSNLKIYGKIMEI